MKTEYARAYALCVAKEIDREVMGLANPRIIFYPMEMEEREEGERVIIKVTQAYRIDE